MELSIGLAAWIVGVGMLVVLGTVGLLSASSVVFEELRAWVRRRRKENVVTYYPPENRFTADQGVKAYRLTHDEWMFKNLVGTAIYDWKLMLLDMKTSHVLAVSTGDNDAELVRTYLREAPKYETPLGLDEMAVVPIGRCKYPSPWGRET